MFKSYSKVEVCGSADDIINLCVIMDPILNPSSDRLTLFPIKHVGLWDMYQKAKASYWVPEEIDLPHDLKDWDKLSGDEQHFLKTVLGFFANSDSIIVENLAARFLGEVQIPEARAFYAFQIAIEQIHAETYSQLIDTYVRDPVEKESLFKASQTIPCIKTKTDWALKWTESSQPFAVRLAAFACVEGIHFSASFAAIFWIRKRGMMPGLCTSNTLIARDEGLHADFACLLYKQLREPLSNETVHALVAEAVDTELRFVQDALPVAVIGMNADAMQQYVRYVADCLLQAMGHPKMYDVLCPFDFMEQIAMQAKENFFETRVTTYQKAGVATHSTFDFDTDADF